MSDKLRVHTLSKELGVTSKAIIAKCKSEDVEGVTNHMSTVSAGLAETIREWFGEESHGTAVEEAAPVDLEKARVKRKKPRKKKVPSKKAVETPAEPLEEAREKPVPVAETEPEEVKPETEVSLDKPEETIAVEPPPVSEVTVPVVEESEQPPSQPMVPAAPGEVSTVSPAGGGDVEQPAESAPVEKPEELKPAARASEPAKPKKRIVPAGPQNVPAPAQMRGPKVIGFAKPDPVSRPVARSSSRPAASGADGGVPEIPVETRGPKRGKGKLAGVGLEDSPGKRGRRRTSPRRSGGSITDVGERLKEWNDRDLLERQERLQAASGLGIHARRAREKKTGSVPARVAARKTKAEVTEPVVLHELCSATGIGLVQIMPKLMRDHGLGMVNRNTVVPNEIAELVMLDFGVDLTIIKPKSKLEQLADEFAGRERTRLESRPPVVTMLGHVDHGKTSLLDALRKTSVAAGEAGGITQHIGAYQVQHGDLAVTFLDTPGHEAFTAMRARGANMTDVVVLVVAADDGVMPQTIEAINHAKAAKVTILVALNKIDIPGVDVNKVYGQLSEMELAPTEWGGETDVVKTSATTGEGITALIEHLAVLSELLDLKADPTLPATGAVIEAKMEQGVGPVARLLVQEGTLKTGDFLVCGTAAGRVRVMHDYRGTSVREAGPGMPVGVAGLDEVPEAGETFYCVETLQRAKDIAEEAKVIRRTETLSKRGKVQTLEDLLQKREGGEIPELNLILRADVQGSIDALQKSLGEIPSDEVKLSFLHTGIGVVTESDVVLATASNALVVGFNVSTDAQAQRLAETEGVDVRSYRVIYNLIDDVRKALEGLLPKDQTEEYRGRAEVRQVFHVSRVGMVAGCMVIDGIVGRSNHIRVIRDGQIIVPTAEDVRQGRHRKIGSLHRFKDDAKEVRAGMECGIRVEGFDDVKPGDVLEAYDVIEVARQLA